MPTSTTNYGLSKPLVNDPTDQDLWGGYLNTDLDSLDGLLLTAMNFTISSQTSTITVTAPTAASTTTGSAKKLYLCNATGGAFTANLPAAATASGMTVAFKKTDSSANAITIDGNASETIDGATTVSLAAQYAFYVLTCDGTGWSIIAQTAPAVAVFTGDSGSGGTTGTVPAPASGTAAKRYMLGAGGSFATQTCVQRVSTETGAVATGSTTIPRDDTIPQNSEGDQYMSLAITPKASANILVIDVVFIGSVSGGGSSFYAALFQDSTANALAASGTNYANQVTINIVSFRHIMTAGTTSSTTFKVRAGGTAGTLTFNGESGSRIFGGVLASSIMITEYSE